jgi:hypothetical protein
VRALFTTFRMQVLLPSILAVAGGVFAIGLPLILKALLTYLL